MEKNSIVRTGKTVDEAIELAILELGVGRDEVEVDVVSRGRSGILGIGAEPAQVSVRLIEGDGSSAGLALGLVDNILKALSVDAWPTIRSSGSGPDSPPIIDIQGEDAGLIIGRRGETLRSLQFLVNLMLSHQEEEYSHVVVDVEQYRERRQRHLRTLAQRMSERAISSGRPVTLEPMPPADRRIIHMTLAEDKGVTTESSGEGNQRQITISPTGEGGGGERPSGPNDRGSRPSGPSDRGSRPSGPNDRGGGPSGPDTRGGRSSDRRPRGGDRPTRPLEYPDDRE